MNNIVKIISFVSICVSNKKEILCKGSLSFYRKDHLRCYQAFDNISLTNYSIFVNTINEFLKSNCIFLNFEWIFLIYAVIKENSI